MRPLDRLGSIKLKLGAVIVAATAVAVAVISIGAAGGISPVVTALIAGVLALAMVQLLARGMTSPLRDMAAAARGMASGRPTGPVVATSQDEVGELARAFNSMAAQLAETERIRRDLVANVSHDLRTPVSGLRAALENLVDGVTEGNEELFRTMLFQTERLGRLVDELLELSRLESGAVTIEPRLVLLISLLEESANESMLGRPDIPVELDVLPERLVARVDPDRFRQIISNLVANAVRVSPAGSKVRIVARISGGKVTVMVLDSGPGIAPADAVHVFERFYRADAARQSDSGAGLGLAIVKWLVDLHRGTVRYEPNSPSGCRMILEIPQGAI